MRSLPRLAGAALLALLAGSAALAGSFQVSPVRVELSPAVPTAVINVRNESATDSVVVQLRAVNWKQEGGEDVYVPSTELIATPPIFTLQPGGAQTVRAGLRRAENRDVEQSFRLFITEVPGPAKPGFQGLQVALNVGIPVFIAPKVRQATPLVWRAAPGGAGQLALSVSNPGNLHVQVLEARVLEGPDVLATTQQPRYLLAGQAATWQLPATRPPKGKLRITARTDAGDVEAEVPLEASAAK
jgi:fimbrial chaperone protein